ncbi:MAG: leucyl aminopeptidase family protein [Fimbriimonadaceae bacterium]|nr:leucyl aminopeptidase family protein [Fimbriimonadaceae bacterium]
MIREVEHRTEPNPQAIVFCVWSDQELPLSLPVEASDAAKRPEFQAKRGQVVEAFPSSGPRVILLGLGDAKTASSESVRKAGVKLAQHLSNCSIESVHIAVDSHADSFEFGSAMGVALQGSTFNVRQFPGARTEDQSSITLAVVGLSESFDKGLKHGIGLGSCVNFTKSLVNTPPNIATPLWMAEQAKNLAKQFPGLEVRVIQGDELEKENLIGHINVGKASSNPPCMIRLAWNPTKSDKKPVVLLGKTVTYDTGGLSIKGKTGMPGMKYDKSGGCAVLGAMMAVASVVQPQFPVVGLLVAAENCIDAVAYRPDDIITYRNGVTVEVTNTDAEGRLVLADGLCWACDVENPACILDIATLTGGIVTALGSEFGGLFCEDSALMNEVQLAGKTSGEEVWHMPVNDGYRDMMRGGPADLVNSVVGGKAHPCQGAAFLSCFCKPEVPYAHIDMAGMSHAPSDEVSVSGPSGWGVRLFTQFIMGRGQ